MQRDAAKSCPGPAAPDRRSLLVRWARWMATAAATCFLYPLLRFTGFKVAAKPRLVEVPAPLPLSGVHTSHDFVLFATDDGGRAVSRICTHLGCRLNYHEDKGHLECPCHQSRFTPEGKRFAGPAERDLPVFEVTQKQDAEGRATAYVVQL